MHETFSFSGRGGGAGGGGAERRGKQLLKQKKHRCADIRTDLAMPDARVTLTLRTTTTLTLSDKKVRTKIRIEEDLVHIIIICSSSVRMYKYRVCRYKRA